MNKNTINWLDFDCFQEEQYVNDYGHLISVWPANAGS